MIFSLSKKKFTYLSFTELFNLKMTEPKFTTLNEKRFLYKLLQKYRKHLCCAPGAYGAYLGNAF